MFRLPCCLVAAAAIAIAGAFLSPVASAASQTVTFQPDSPWAQQVGALTRSNYRSEYSVAIQPGKTLQINLVTRNPNIFFKVHKEGRFTPLVDTFKTGERTWSTPSPEGGTYTIEVYIDKAAIADRDQAKYALQIGQYGAQDMQPASTPVTFTAGNPWSQQVGSLDATGSAHDYTLVVPAGNTLQVNLIAHDPAVRFKVFDQAQEQPLFDSTSTDAATWSTPVTASTNFKIRVYADAAAVPPGKKLGYALQVGQYPSGEAQPSTPAAAGTAGG